jgi:hypothetical protein
MQTTTSNNIYELVVIILEEQFSKEVSEIGSFLLNNGPSTLLEITSSLKSIDYPAARNVIIILLQNKLATFKEVKRKELKELAYELIIENVLNYLRFPKILYTINDKFGEYGVMIFEEFMQFGILTAKHTFDAIKDKLQRNKRGSATSANTLKNVFITLIENGYIVQTMKMKNEEIKGGKKKKDKEENEKKVVNKKKRKPIESKQMEDSESLFDNFNNQTPKKNGTSIESNNVEEDNPLIVSIFILLYSIIKIKGNTFTSL